MDFDSPAAQRRRAHTQKGGYTAEIQVQFHNSSHLGWHKPDSKRAPSATRLALPPHRGVEAAKVMKERTLEFE